MADLTWPRERMAKFIDVSPRRLNQLVHDGIVPKQEKGRFNPFVVTVAYIRFLRDRVQSPDSSSNDYMAEKLGKTRAERGLSKILDSKSMSEIEKEQLLNDLVSLRDADL